ncbi:tetratricopeptide repeat-containing sensor histidine kinase [Tenacibaculum ovolyticum]|uniref:ATP-binding protein n=1 Tax=Tenacibaculum ovolyticum TaxID=104270 RepID=UPI003BA89C8B
MKINLLNYQVLLVLILFGTNNILGQNSNDNIIKDSINIWIKKSKNNSLKTYKRSLLLNQAYNSVIKLDETVYKCKTLNSIAYRYYTLKDTATFKKINSKTLLLALKLKDTFTIADSHWSYANFYNDYEIYDKSYYHYKYAYDGFKKLNMEYESARMLYAMAFIKGRFRDYIGSEILNFKAIEKFKKLNHYKYLYISYNHLGSLQEDIKEYDKALQYYNKALLYFSKVKKKKYLSTFNNIGNIYLKKKQFKKALEYYNKDIKKKITKSQIARVITNKASCQLLLSDTTSTKKNLFNALHIRDSMMNKAGIVNSKIHISNYYKYIKDTTNALKYAKEANSLAKEIKNGGDYLTTLKQLADLDTKNTKKHLDRYIAFNDSLISAERRTQNKFTRIEFETDEYIEETERLNQQQIWIIVTSIAGILILSLLYFLRVQKVKNEKLQLESEQQKANEEVYILTLQQKAKLEEEKVKERNRISEELHDGVLGKLFGTRFGLGFLNIKGDDDVLEKHQSLLNELQDIEKEIRDVSHKLNDNFNSDTVNFTFIITQLLKDKSELGGFTYEFNIDNEISWKTTNEVTKANIYRIIQEALQNILKHAKAEKVTLAFSKDDQHIIIELKDNGVGFNSKKGKKGIGIKNIKSRVKKLNGSVEFLSELTKGTSLIIKIPYKFE